VSSQRLVLVPVALFCIVSGGVFGLAKLHLARPGLPKTSGAVKLGDFYRGETVFSQHCAACHGQGGVGGKIGKRLVDDPISLQTALAHIEGGGSVMPPGLVKGKDERDVLAYLATILGKNAS
jgi:mono/diheme cytochrome c family protein